MTPRIDPEHPKHTLLFFLEQDINNTSRKKVREFIESIAGIKEWVIGPPCFVDERQDNGDKTPIETVGGYIELHPSWAPWQLPPEIDLQQLQNVEVLVAALCQFSRENKLSFAFELEGDETGRIDDGVADEMLTTGFIREWRRTILTMNALELLEAHRYDEAIVACRQRLIADPDDIAAVATLASALRATGAYREAISLFERVSEDERKALPDHPGYQADISCLHWCLGDQGQAIKLMRGLVEGILDGSINYGDLAGGVEQGLLLYYMGTTARDPDAAAFALKYLRNRAKRSAIESWPGPLARYYLGDMSFEDVLSAATGQRNVTDAIVSARTNFLSLRQLCGAVFHDGVRHRAQGAEDLCLARMRECYALEDPLIELEWYLARYEVEHAEQRPLG
jgi:tetratricopeptide (TPR) repeat protein